MKHVRRAFLIAVAAFAFCASLAAAPAENIAYTDRVSGDEAVSQGDFPAAASFYERYLDRAKKNQDLNAQRDAMERRIDALILAGMADPADKLLQEYTRLFPGRDSLARSLWQADIHALRNNPQETIKVLERIMPGFTLDDPRRARAVFTLGRACEKVGDLHAAAKIYFSLLNSEKIPVDRRMLAYGRGIFCLALSDQPDRAMQELLSVPPEMDADTLRLLTILIVARKDGFACLRAAWNAAAEKNPETVEKTFVPLYAVLYSAIGDLAQKNREMEIAQKAYLCAYGFAEDREEAIQTMQRLAAVLDLQGKSEESARIADSILKVFCGPYATPEMRLGAARIYGRSGRLPQAVQLYESMRQDPRTDAAVLNDAMRECVYLQYTSGSKDEALKLLKDFFGEKDPATADFIHADLLLRSGDQARAAEVFLKIAGTYPEKRSSALYQASTALIESGNLEEALKAVEGLAKSGGDESRCAGYLRALILEKSGAMEKALPEYEEFIRSGSAVKPDFMENAVFRAGYLSAVLGKSAAASGYFDKLTHEFPNSGRIPAAGYWQIYLLCMSGDFVGAEYRVWGLAEKYPDSPCTMDAFSCLTDFYADSGNTARADEILKNRLKHNLSPDFRQRILLERARLLFRMKNFASASAALAEIPEKSVFRADADYLAAEIFRENGAMEKALVYYRKAAAKTGDPALKRSAQASEADTLFVLGNAQNNTSLYEAAEKINRTLLADTGLLPSFRAATLYKTGRICQVLGRKEEAVQLWKEVCYLAPGAPPADCREWIIRSAEAIYSVALDEPLRAMRESAASAFRVLEKNGYITPEDAQKRLKLLKKKVRSNP